MALPFLSNSNKKRDQVVVIDLGTRVTKAICLQRKGDTYHFVSYVLVDAPTYERSITADVLSAHLKAVVHALGAKAKHVVIVLGVADSILRNAEMPVVGASDMRQMLKFNSKSYLQQDFPDYLFDCHILPIDQSSMKAEPGKGVPKCKVLIGGAKRPLVTEVQSAAKLAGLVADEITTALSGPANAFEAAMPDIFTKEVVALVDVGYKNSTISILLAGELMLSRVVGFGAAKLTTGIAESLGISSAEAEGIKVGMPQEVEGTIQPLLTPLGRELRASIDFFEHQADKTVSQVFFSGGSARSEYIVQALQAELMVPCKSWNPASFISMLLPAQQMSDYEQIAPQLVVAFGAAVSVL